MYATSNNFIEKGHKYLCLALATSFALTVVALPAQAQGYGSNNFGSEQDSLLPPEVVPIDPTSAGRVAQSQALNFEPAQTVPGLAGGAETSGSHALAKMQSAKDYRKAALESLMNQKVAPYQYSGSGSAFGNQLGAQMPGQVPGQQVQGIPPLDTNSMQQAPLTVGQNGTQLGMSPIMQPGAAGNVSAPQTIALQQSQSQTLTGSVKKAKATRQDTRRGGFTHAASALTGFGSGFFMGSVLRSPGSLAGFGLYGLASTGLGMRNGLRF